MQEAHFVEAFLQTSRQLARGGVELLANTSFGVFSQRNLAQKRAHLVLGAFVSSPEVMVFNFPCLCKLKARVATCAMAYSVYIQSHAPSRAALRQKTWPALFNQPFNSRVV